MTLHEAKEAERLLQKYDVHTLAPLAVSCGMIRILKEREDQIERSKQSKQLSFDWAKGHWQQP